MTTDSFPTVDGQYASADLKEFFTAFFKAKSAKEIDKTMSFFSEELITYTDAILGWEVAGFDALRGFFGKYMPTWSDTARSYPMRIYGHQNRAVVEFVDSPELFGSELRLLGSVDMIEGKILRWIDYWNGRTFPSTLYHKLRTSPVPTPTQILPLTEKNSVSVRSATSKLADAFSHGDVNAVVALLATDTILEDYTLNLIVRGRAEIARFLTGAIAQLPYGSGSRWSASSSADAHSGGIEWTSSANWSGVQGVLAIGCNDRGAVERLASIYDGRLCSDDQLVSFLATAVGPNEAT